MGLYAVFRLSEKARIQVFGGEVWGWVLRFPRMDSMDHSMVPKKEANLDRMGKERWMIYRVDAWGGIGVGKLR